MTKIPTVVKIIDVKVLPIDGLTLVGAVAFLFSILSDVMQIVKQCNNCTYHCSNDADDF